MSSMLQLLEKEIESLNLSECIPAIVDAIADSIPSTNIPRRMKLGIAVEEIMLFASEFRINIQHWNSSSIPINSIMFITAKSGASKDSSLRAARKCFKGGYEKLNKKRIDSAVESAINLARENGCEEPEKFSNYKQFYKEPEPLFVGISTPEGFIQHINDLEKSAYGSGYIYSGEVGQDLSTNPNMPELIKALAETYDEGTKEVKMVKNKEYQSKEIKNFPISALFIGSQDNLLYNEIIKSKFKTEFTTKLARRSFFIFIKEEIEEPSFNSVKELIEANEALENKSIESRNQVVDFIDSLTDDLLYKFESRFLTPSQEVRDLFTMYKRYNEEIANTIDTSYPISKLTRMHLQWKAFKMSGALALMECSSTIEADHYKAAMAFCEMISDDIHQFEVELTKESYELFTSYCKEYAKEGYYAIGIHNLRKYGFITLKGLISTSLSELVKLANSYDELGTYSVNNSKDGIEYKEIKKSENILLSYVEVNGTKKQRATQCAKGFECQELSFADLEDMLKGDYAYCPFKFTNGVRGKENICSTCKWIVLDIDDSNITDKEAHLLLEDINHYVVRTSNKDVATKYRVLIELDAEVDIPNIRWKQFITNIAEDLGFKIDGLAKSQIYFSYSDREILSTLDSIPLNVKPYLDMLANKEIKIKVPSKATCSKMLEDPLTTFNRAFDAKDGEGRRKLVWAVRRASELGCNLEYAINLLNQINDYWVIPLPEDELEAMINSISKWSCWYVS